jgi:pimeloyl-ACP methyl ester carboxylesterase
LQVPETRYAKSGDVNIAYHVVGDGPFDLVYVPGFITHLELAWKLRGFAPFLRRLASFSRLILFDKRGTGMSDPVSGAPTLETRMDDVRAVMDAVGSERAALFGLSEGASMSALFAATYPERTAALVLRSGSTRTMWAPDYPWGRTEEDYQGELERELRIFGPRAQGKEALASLGRFDEDDLEQFLDYLRFGSSPGTLEALLQMNKEIDIRHVLPAVHVPTLVLHGSEDKIVPLDAARYLAERIPGAVLVEVPGAGHLALGEPAVRINAELERFLTDVWEGGAWERPEPDRILATILFTDVVGSTAKAAELGDSSWRELLEEHHLRIRRQLMRYRGVELDTAGDGFFARFDGPARAIRCARAVGESLKDLGLEIRAGLHTGECELVDNKVAGIAVAIGARVAAQAQPGEVLVSQTVKDLVAGSGIEFEDRGVAELKGVPGEWRLHAVESV